VCGAPVNFQLPGGHSITLPASIMIAARLLTLLGDFGASVCP
jgi:hypothetical protein